MTRVRSVAWMEPGFREYRACFLKKLAAALREDGLHLVAAHADSRLATNQRDEAPADCLSRPLASVRFALRDREVLLSAPPPNWIAADLVVLPENIGYPTAWLILAARHAVRKRTAVFGHGTDFSKPGRNDLAERLNMRRMEVVDWWLAYNDLSARAVALRGMPSDRITAVNNTLDTGALIASRAALSRDDVAALRRSLGIERGPTALFIGALYPKKRVPELVVASDRIRSRHPGFSLLVVGDGPSEAAVDQAAEGRPWVKRLPGDTSAARVKYWALADLALYPSAAGLAINESLALGVPPILSASNPHGPEAGYVVDGVNGQVIRDDGSMDAFADAVSSLLLDDARLGELRHRAGANASALSMDNMVARARDGITRALAAPPRRWRPSLRSRPCPEEAGRSAALEESEIGKTQDEPVVARE